MSKSASVKSLLSKRHTADIKKLKERCEELQIECRSLKDAKENDICILSMNDYELECSPSECKEENRPYFIDKLDYDYFWHE